MRKLWIGCCWVCLACNGDPKRVGDDDDDVATSGCEVDDDCLPFVEICGDAGTCEAGDRDDAFESASPLFLGDDQAKHGVLATAGDVDTYAYESPGDEWVSVRTVVDDGAAEAGLDTYLTLHRANGAIHAQIDDFPVYPFRVTGFDSVLYAYLPEAGTWYVSVQDATTLDPGAEDAYGEDFAYDVLIREAFGAVESDSAADPGAALVLPDGDTIFTIGIVVDAPGDVDYVTIETPGDQALELWSTVGLDGSEAQPVVELYDGDTRVATKAGLGPDGWLSWFEAVPGTYRAELRDAAGGGPDHWFPLFARTYNPGDNLPFFGDNTYVREAEPNDGTGGLAVPPDPVTTTGGGDYDAYRVQGRMDAPADEDPWTVTVTAGDLLSVRCWTDRFGSEAVVAVSLWSGGADFGSSDSSDADDYFLVDVEAPATGAIELRVADAGGGVGAAGWYRCALYAQ